VDLDTDKAIQEIIQGPAFQDVTILTIAYVMFKIMLGTLSKSLISHRLNTILESDRILVMDAGCVSTYSEFMLSKI